MKSETKADTDLNKSQTSFAHTLYYFLPSGEVDKHSCSALDKATVNRLEKKKQAKEENEERERGL